MKRLLFLLLLLGASAGCQTASVPDSTSATIAPAPPEHLPALRPSSSAPKNVTPPAHRDSDPSNLSGEPDKIARRQPVQPSVSEKREPAHESPKTPEAQGPSEDRVAQFIVKALQQRDPATGPQILIDALQLPYEKVRLHAADELGHLKSADAVQPLSDVALVDPRPSVRIAAVNALVQIDAAKAAPTLEKVLQDAEPPVVAAAATGLGKAGLNSSITPLMLALPHKSPLVRGAAADALGRMGDKRAVKPLISLLASDDVIEVRQQAARALGLLKDKQALPELVRSLDSSEPSLRIFAIDALGEIGDTSVLDSLKQMLATSDSEGVRQSAAVALGKLADPEALPALRLALKQNDEKLRQLAFGAIVNICRPSPRLLSDTADNLLIDQEYARAAQLLELFLQTTDDKPDLALMVQAARRNLSRCYLAQEQWSKALKLLEDLNRTNPDDPVLIEGYARALAGTEKWAEAFRQYSRLAQVSKQENGCWPERLSLLDTMVARKRFEQVVDMVREVERAPETPPDPIPARLKELKKTSQFQLVETAAAAPDGPDKLVRFLASDEETERDAARTKLRELSAAAYPALVAGLADASPKVRRASLEFLRGLSGQAFGFDPEGTPEARAKAVELWREWLKTAAKAPENPAPRKE